MTLDLSGLGNCATNIENMVIGINANGASISPDPRIARDYSQPVQFTLTAPDGTKVVYTVTVKGAACITAPPPSPPPSQPSPPPAPTPDTTPPVITVLGTNLLSLTVGTVYTEAGATCVDNKDPSCTVVTTGTVNTAAAASYTITYTATDAAGNVSTAARTVNVTALIVPTVSFAQTSYDALEETTINNPLITNSLGTVTYASSNTAIATVNATSGQVTILPYTGPQDLDEFIGTVTVTATQAATPSFAAASKSYVINVTCNSAANQNCGPG